MIAPRSLLACSLVLLAACGGAPKPAKAPAPAKVAAPDAAPAAANATDADLEEAAEADGPTVTLLDAGEGPRRRLRYRFRKGAEAWGELDLRMAMTMSAPRVGTRTVEAPASRMVFRARARDVSSTGQVTLEYELVEAKLAEGTARTAIARPLAGSLKKMVGLHGRVVIGPRGIAHRSEIDVPEGADAPVREQLESMRDSMRSFHSPLPVEEVGRGARWQVDWEIRAMDLVLAQRAVYRIESIEGDEVNVRVTIDQSAPAQAFLGRKLPPGASARLLRMQGHGGGAAVFALGELFGSASMETKSTQELEMTVKGVTVPMKMETSMGMDLGPTQSPADRPPWER